MKNNRGGKTDNRGERPKPMIANVTEPNDNAAFGGQIAAAKPTIAAGRKTKKEARI